MAVNCTKIRLTARPPRGGKGNERVGNRGKGREGREGVGRGGKGKGEMGRGGRTRGRGSGRGKMVGKRERGLDLDTVQGPRVPSYAAG